MRRVVAVLLVSTICLTLSDFLFKSMVARLIPAERLGAFLGTRKSQNRKARISK